MENLIVILIVAAVVGLACGFIYKEKKRGVKCVGCPFSAECSGKCSGCSGNCSSCAKDSSGS